MILTKMNSMQKYFANDCMLSKEYICGKIHKMYSPFSDVRRLIKFTSALFFRSFVRFVNNVHWIFGMIIWPLDSSKDSDMSWATCKWARTILVHNSTLTNVSCLHIISTRSFSEKQRKCVCVCYFVIGIVLFFSEL